MQDQGKRLLVAVALALGVMMLWQVLFTPDKPVKEPPPPPQGSAAVQPAPGPGATPDALRPSAPVVRGPEQLITLRFPRFEVTFTSHGGAVKSWHLVDKRFDRDPGKGELLPTQRDTGAFGVHFPGSTYELPLGAEWTGTQVSPTEVRYAITTDHLDVEKTFVVVPDANLVRMTVRANVKVPAGQQAKQTLATTVFGYQDPADDGGGGQSIAPRIWESGTYRAGEMFLTGVKAVQQRARYESGIAWTGFAHPYLLVALAPKPVGGVFVGKQTVADATGLMRTDVVLRQDVVFAPDSAPLVAEVVGYLGPRSYDRLEAADEAAGFATGMTETVDLGWFAFIGRPLLWLLLKFYAFVGNWGVAIMLLTLLVKGLTIPFTTKSMRSMKAIAVLAPQLKELQEKYKHDRQRMQMETMALYKQHGANPLSGCLPILLQMPIWLALYRMLSSAGELYQQPFLPGWIDDLTTSDPYYALPIILMVTMFVQARLTPMGPATDPTQKLQQRMMQYGLPLMFGVMGFFFPAGLTLYIFTNTVLSAFHSIYMNKFDKKSIELSAKIKAAQEKAAAAKEGKVVKDTKPAPAAPDDEDDEGEDDDADEAKAPEAKPRPRPQHQSRNKRKKRRR